MINWIKDRLPSRFNRDTIVDFNDPDWRDIYGTGNVYLRADVSSLANLATSWVAESVQKAHLHIMRDGMEVTSMSSVDMMVQKLLDMPHPLYTGKMLQYIIARDRMIHGTCFVEKVRGENNVPVRLVYIPYRCVEPQFDGNNVLTHYEIESGTGGFGKGRARSVSPDDMITFRNGICEDNLYLGEGSFDRLGHAMYVDEEALKFSAAVFKNAISGVVASVERDENMGMVAVSADEARAFNERLKSAFGSTSKGATMFFNSKLKLDRLEPSFTMLDLEKFHNLCEERICAKAYVHPSVLGLGTGVRNTRIGATAREYRRESWENGVLPVLESISEEYTVSLIPEFYGMDSMYKVGYNVGHINALRYSVDEVMAMVDRGVMTNERALVELGLNDSR